MPGRLKYAGFVRVNDEWRFEGWLVDGESFNSPEYSMNAEARIKDIRKVVEEENGPETYRTIAFVDGAREGKQGESEIAESNG